MRHRSKCAAALLAAGIAAIVAAQSEKPNFRTSPLGYTDTPVIPGQKWRVHDIDRPHPRAVTPGATLGAPPSDAVVLFDGKDLSKWEPSKWKLGDGYVEVVGHTGDLVSKEKFGDAQFHIEWAAPSEIMGTSQWRGNSGILIMHRYEIQVLDSYNSPTYADGQAGAIYGQWPPLVNASRPPGQWQTYDILWEAPKLENGKLTKPAYVTVIHNGVMLHHHKEVIGEMAHRQVSIYKGHGPEEPLALQDHDTPVRYRNIWVRRIGAYDRS